MKKALTSAVAIALLAALQVNAIAAGGCMRGINLSGAEFGKPGGKIHKDYDWPSDHTVSYFAAKGFDTVRLPFLWERLQPKLLKPFDQQELNRLKETVELIRSYGMRVILDPHNYARYRDQIVGSDAVPDVAFADFWRRLAALYANDDNVVFGLMNEPNRMPIEQWLSAANAAAAAIRDDAHAHNLILVPGTAWSGAHSWMKPIDGEPNGVVMAKFDDPQKHFAFEVHQYLDSDFSGTTDSCARAGDAALALKDFTGWLKKTGNKGFLGEFGASGATKCVSGLKAMVDVMEENHDVWTGWSYWVAGDWWPESEPLNIQPTKTGDRPQLKALEPALHDFSAEGKSCPALD
jgi:endoglucanase